MKRILLAAAVVGLFASAPAVAQGYWQNGSAYGSSAAGQQRYLSRADIMEIQQALNDKGYSPGVVDGFWGRRTQNALRQFQRENGMESAGRLDMNTLNELGVDISMNENMRSQGMGTQGAGSSQTGGATPFGMQTRDSQGSSGSDYGNDASGGMSAQRGSSSGGYGGSSQ